MKNASMFESGVWISSEENEQPNITSNVCITTATVAVAEIVLA